MNSQKLRTDYPDIYNHFFSQHEIVCSAPFMINRSSENYMSWWGVSIKQKIPLRLYVGAKRRNPSTDSMFGTITYYDIFTDQFSVASLSEYLPYFSWIEKFFDDRYDRSEVPVGREYIFSVLVEQPRSVGLWFDDILVLVLCAMLSRLEDTLFSKKIENWSTLTLSDVIKNFCGHNRWEWVLLLSHMLFGSRYITWYTLGCFCDGAYPVISFWSSWCLPSSSCEYYVYRLDELWDFPKTPYCSMDYGVFFSWTPIVGYGICSILEEHFDYLEDVIAYAKTNLWKDVFGKSYLSRPSFYRSFCQSSQKNELFLSYNRSILSMSIEMCYFLTKAYSSGFKISEMEQCSRIINTIRALALITRRLPSSLQGLPNAVSMHFDDKMQCLWLMYADIDSAGWSVFFAMPKEKCRQKIVASLDTLWSDYSNLKMLYSVWVDGYEYAWIHFDQDFENGIFYSDTTRFTLSLSMIGGHTVYGNYEDVIQQSNCDLLIDEVYMKLYVAGKKTTSKDLHTQVWTVELLSNLLKREWKEVLNNELPLSIYSKNKNEMSGKVISPLIKLIKERVWKHFPLSISGQTYQFSVKVWDHNVSIGVLSKCK